MRHRSLLIVLAVLLGPVLCAGAAAAQTTDRHGNTVIGPIRRDDAYSFRVYLPLRDPDGLASFVDHVSNPADPLYHRFLTPEQLSARFGATPQSLDALASALRQAGLTVTDRDARSIGVTGWSETVEAFIGSPLDHVVTPGGEPLVAARSAMTLPRTVTALGAQIFAFRGVIRMHTSHSIVKPLETGTTGTGPFLTSDMKQAYDAPTFVSLSGTGATIGILISGTIAPSDLQGYFNKVGVTAPSFTVTTVDGGGTKASLEGTLDVQQAGGFAPSAAIIQYGVPDLSDQSIIDGLSAIVTANQVDVVSMSFGSCELNFLAFWDGAFSSVDTVLAEDSLFAQGAAQGITFVASSGDSGALGCSPAGYGNEPSTTSASSSFLPGVQNPASSPNVTAVGGTNLTVSAGTAASTYVAENANFDPLMPKPGDGGTANLNGAVWGSGGGASVLFARPSYQQLVTTGIATRAVPDVALHMGGCPEGAVGTCPAARSSDFLFFQGQGQGILGTSAAAPDFAGVIALMVQSSGHRQGRANDRMYMLAQAQTNGGAAAFHRNIPGNNGVYTSSATGSPAYNMVIGNGTLDIRQFMQVTNLAAAGAPGSPSNP
jgi:subtilase family serine protease